MSEAIILTTPHGIGANLANYLQEINVSPHLYAIDAEEISGSRVNKQDRGISLDVNKSNVLNLQFPQSKYFIWSTGVFLKKSLFETSDSEIDVLTKLHYTFPLRLLRQYHRQQKKPYHLIVIASCSSWRLRQHEALYCGLSAAKASFARNFANDLMVDLPGSKVTLINPGGMKTPYYYPNEEIHGNQYLDSNWVAAFIWNRVEQQTKNFEEVQVLRCKTPDSNAAPIIEEGAKLPEHLKL